jgi:hypothetical protein
VKTDMILLVVIRPNNFLTSLFLGQPFQNFRTAERHNVTVYFRFA